jgi:hypothetical protein
MLDCFQFCFNFASVLLQFCFNFAFYFNLRRYTEKSLSQLARPAAVSSSTPPLSEMSVTVRRHLQVEPEVPFDRSESEHEEDAASTIGWGNGCHALSPPHSKRIDETQHM